MALITSDCVPRQSTALASGDPEAIAAAIKEVPSWLTAAIPMENPYHCSCRLTRVRQAEGKPGVSSKDISAAQASMAEAVGEHLSRFYSFVFVHTFVHTFCAHFCVSCAADNLS